jgi:hypothetical protein
LPARGAGVAVVQRELERFGARSVASQTPLELREERVDRVDGTIVPTEPATFGGSVHTTTPGRHAMPAAPTQGPLREWVVFQDPKRKKHVWHVDVTFLSSHWTCIYGSGCQGVLTEPAPEMEQGCCSYGAHASGKKDRELVERVAKKLSDDEWQFKRRALKKGVWVKTGKDDWRTRLADGACIFLNRPGFGNGPGCALHQHAIRTGQHHSDVKPEVCWQLPLRNIEEYDEDAGDDIIHHRLTEFARHGWGDGGEEFAWWCTEAKEAFVGSEPVYLSMEAELRKMVGDTLYEMIAEYLETRLEHAPAPVLHPSEVPVRFGPTRVARSA